MAADGWRQRMDRSWRDRLLLAGVCCLLWLPPLVSRTVWHPDEPRFALLTQVILETGEYIAPLKMGEVYHSKPLLHLWSTALISAALGGVGEISMRTPSFLAGLGGVLATYGLASSLFGSRTGLLAALVLATDVRYLTQAHWASTDMLLCFFMTAALVSFHAGYRSRKSRWYLLMHAMCALATLTKGPVGFVLPAAVVLGFLAVRRDSREIARLRLVSGALIMLAVAGPWLLLYSRRAGGDETWALLVTENIQRYLNAWNNVKPWHYYLWRFPLDFLPWTLLLPAAVWHSRSRMEAEDRGFLWIWFAAVFIFYSISSGKRGVYLLPLHPPAAILVGWFWERATAAPWPGDERWLRGGRWGMGAAFTLLGAVMATMAPRLLEPMGGAGGAGLIAWGLLTSAAGFAIILQPQQRTIALTAVAVGVVVAGFVTHGIPAINQREDLVAFAGEIAERVPDGAALGIVTHTEELAFYAGRRPAAKLKPGRMMDRWLETPGTIYMILDQRCLDDLKSRPGLRWELLTERQLSRGRYYVVVRPEKQAEGQMSRLEALSIVVSFFNEAEGDGPGDPRGPRCTRGALRSDPRTLLTLRCS